MASVRIRSFTYVFVMRSNNPHRQSPMCHIILSPTLRKSAALHSPHHLAPWCLLLFVARSREKKSYRKTFPAQNDEKPHHSLWEGKTCTVRDWWDLPWFCMESFRTQAHIHGDGHCIVCSANTWWSLERMLGLLVHERMLIDRTPIRRESWTFSFSLM